MSVYGNSLNKKFDENSKINPISCYGVSKIASEKYIKVFSKNYRTLFLECLMFMDRAKT